MVYCCFPPPALPCPSPSLVLALWLLLGWWLALGTKSGQALEPGYSTSFCCPPLPLVDEKVALPCKNCLVPFHVPPCPRPSVRPSVRLAGSSDLHSSPPPLSVQRLFLLLASEIYQLWAVSTYPPPPSKELTDLPTPLLLVSRRVPIPSHHRPFKRYPGSAKVPSKILDGSVSRGSQKGRGATHREQLQLHPLKAPVYL